MDKSISIEMINKYQKACDADEKLKISRNAATHNEVCLLYTSPSPRDATLSRMPSSA